MITVAEGLNRQVRRMCEAAGLRVARLTRVSEGSLGLGDLKPGAWRDLTPEEAKALTGAKEVKRQCKA
jgi:23S rRNA pseudouridine2605 synthase